MQISNYKFWKYLRAKIANLSCDFPVLINLALVN